MKILRMMVVLLVLPAVGWAELPQITLNPNNEALIAADGIGVNMDSKLMSDVMWEANGQWIAETYQGVGVRFLRWGDPKWNWDEDTPLSFGMWTKYNTRDDAGSRGLREFIAYCKETDTTPLMITPVRAEDLSDYTWAEILDLSSNLALYVESQSLNTDVYFSLGNEPGHNGYPQATYEAKIADFGAMIHNVNPAFNVIVHSHKDYDEAAMYANVGDYYDGIDRHEYTAMNDMWTTYYNKDNDTFFRAFGVAQGGKETILGECNTLWPDWFLGPMANDLKGGLTLINGLCYQIDRRNAAHILPWPSLWPGDNDNDPYGLFNYDEWILNGRTRLFTGQVWAQRIVNENILTHRIAGETTGDAKVRVFGYTDVSHSRCHVILINKRETNQAVVVNTTLSYDYVNAFVFQGTNQNDQAPDYKPLGSMGRAVGGAVTTNTLPPESAVVLRFYNDASTGAPGAFTLVSPSNGTTGACTYKLFEWDAAADAKNYRLVVAWDAGFSQVVFDRDVGNLTQYQVINTNLEFATTYYWKVEAENKNGSTWASNGGISFTTAPTPATPLMPRGLRNGDFESGYGGWVDWGSMAKTDDPAKVYAGDYSGAIGPDSGGCGQDIYSAVPGREYTLSFQWKQDHASDICYAGMDYLDASGTKVGEWEVTLPVATLYQPYTTNLVIPASTWRCLFWYWKSNPNGLMLFDEVLFEDADEDGDGMPDWWEDEHGGGPTNLTAFADGDGDGLSNYEEYIANCCPTNGDSVLCIEGVEQGLAGDRFIVRWQSQSNRLYGLDWLTNLFTDTGAPLASGLSATPPQNIYTDATHGADAHGYYRVNVTMP